MNTTCFHSHSAAATQHIRGGARRVIPNAFQDDFDDDKPGETRWPGSHDWDDAADEEVEFDPEPGSEDWDDDFDFDQFPDELESPPEELWNDTDWE